MVHHGEFLRAASKDDHLVYHMERDWQRAPLEADERVMLAFCRKLTLEPGRVAQADVDALRAAGFDDRAVLDVVLITSMFAFMNRLLDGVGYRAEEPFRAAKQRGDARVEAELQGEGEPPRASATASGD